MATSSAALADAARQLRALDAEFVRLANAGDAKALVEAFYAEDAQLLPPNAPKAVGRAAITQFWKTFIDAGAKDVRLDTTDIQASGDLAYAVGKYTLTMAGQQHEGKYLAVYRRGSDGRYQAVVDTFSANA